MHKSIKTIALSCLLFVAASLESAQQQIKTEIHAADVHPLLHFNNGYHCKVCAGEVDQTALQNMQQANKNHFLRDAVIKNDLNAVKRLLRGGAQVHAACMDKTPLHEAALLGHSEVVQELLNYAEVEVNALSQHNPHGVYIQYTPLMLALSRGKLGFQYIQRQKIGCKVSGGTFNGILNSGAYVSYEPQRGSDADYESIVEQLLQRGTLSKDYDKKNESAIVIAAQYGTLRMVQMLIAAGIDLNASMMVERIPEQTTYSVCHEYRYLHKFENVIKIAIDTHNVELLKIVLFAGARADNPIMERTAVPGEFGFLEYTTALQNPLLYLKQKYNALNAFEALPEEKRKKVSEIFEELLVHGAAQNDYKFFCSQLKWIGADCALKNAENRMAEELKRVLIEHDYLLPDLAKICNQY